MKIIIKTPTRAYLEDYSESELKSIRKQLAYTNKSVAYQIKAHKEKMWWKNKDFDSWDEALQDLESKLHGDLVKQDGDALFIRSGSLPYLELDELQIINTLEYPKAEPYRWAKPLEFKPYSYQYDSVDKLPAIKHGNVSLPTGCGKSAILLMITQSMGLRTVIITPSKSIFNELMAQFQDKLGKHIVGGYGDGKKDISKPITIAIGKSITLLEKGTEAYEFFYNKQLLLCDESHTFAADQLEDCCHGVLENIPYRFFVSATQTRNDGTEKLLYSIIGETVLSMTLEEATQSGYLCPLDFTIIKTFSPDTREIRDPMKCKRVHFLYNREIAALIAKIANASWNIKQESTLILVEELYQIKLLKDLIKVPFGYVHSAATGYASEFGLEKVNLQEQVDRFNNGEIKVLIGTSAISTGTNMYPVHNTCNWVGGSSEIETKQGSMGRSTRLLEKSKYKDLHKPKIRSMIYDFNVSNIPMLTNQLKKRLKFYSETGKKVKID